MTYNVIQGHGDGDDRGFRGTTFGVVTFETCDSHTRGRDGRQSLTDTGPGWEKRYQWDSRDRYL